MQHFNAVHFETQEVQRYPGRSQEEYSRKTYAGLFIQFRFFLVLVMTIRNEWKQ